MKFTISTCLLLVLTPVTMLCADENGFTPEMETMVITSTREATSKDSLSESVGVLSEQELEFLVPSHPAEALNRIAGVHINNLGGEGHMTSIRQPITTSGVYLFLEDGIPTRPTGFFNHNGLYEINVPQSSRLEVTKGPSSALYGSDAIGGVINTITKVSPSEAEASIGVELGEFGAERMLLSGGNSIGEESGLRFDLNVSDNDGWRDDSSYQRTTLGLRFDSVLSEDWSMNVVASYSDIDQSGSSTLNYDDYKHNPTKNTFQGDIGYREVKALRLSSEFAYQPSEQQLLTITPFYRHNDMNMMPSWMVTYDPNIRQYSFESYGLLLKYRQDLWDDKARIIVGIDSDFTPSSYLENDIDIDKEEGFYRGYVENGKVNYDFSADQLSLSPYIHTEWQVSDRWRLNAGIRYDYFNVDYDNKVGVNSDSSHFRPPSQSVTHTNLTPKLGAVFQYTENHNLYLSYRQAFRAATVGALFRPGSATNSADLEPVTATSYELGLRGQFNDSVSYEAAIYDMQIENDIVSYVDGSERKTTNAGETEHRGIELGVDWKISSQWQLGSSLTYTKQKYKDYSYIYGHFSPTCHCYVKENLNFSGNDIGKAPKDLANVRLAYRPKQLDSLKLELEWAHVGEYFTDETNTHSYAGHDLLNLRANYQASDSLSVYLRALNLADKRYSTYTSNQVGSDEIAYRPGLPRTLYVGFNYAFFQ
ncbi:outer membrane receptor protein involved in Fe transport [Sinobacterium caligoides]|uniref:Outer membrane receptor protein involved in Fe transport n=1 Tax=Sinobacterium caligoides TaxID=933926 RepID=A0A3N2E073_9GAMM|nr:TonB-dependent receptor [Sinobacterium caligoides]ROS05312.1 outer membrane receptor protein involved in Fe transport [Sinobacterium caligoides]